MLTFAHRVPLALLFALLGVANFFLGGMVWVYVGFVIGIGALELISVRTRNFIYLIAPGLCFGVCYDFVRFIPRWARPDIHVTLLPDVEEFFFGGFPHRWLSAHPSAALDLFAALVYQLHYVAPVVVLALLIRRHQPLLRNYVWSFALLSIASILTQYLLPTAAPWYLEKYGYFYAHYGMPGNPAGLARVDQLLGIQFFTKQYQLSAVVFGAFPSMHGAWPVLSALYLHHYRTRVAALFWLYTLWMWWAAMYLHHHYAIDLIGGSAYAILAYRFLMHRQQWAPAMAH